MSLPEATSNEHCPREFIGQLRLIYTEVHHEIIVTSNPIPSYEQWNGYNWVEVPVLIHRVEWPEA